MHVLCVLGTLVLCIRIQLTIHPLSPLSSGLVDGLQDRLLFPSLYDITLNVTELGDGNRSIVLCGEATPQVYEQVSVYMHLLMKCFVYTINVYCIAFMHVSVYFRISLVTYTHAKLYMQTTCMYVLC